MGFVLYTLFWKCIVPLLCNLDFVRYCFECTNNLVGFVLYILFWKLIIRGVFTKLTTSMLCMIPDVIKESCHFSSYVAKCGNLRCFSESACPLMTNMQDACHHHPLKCARDTLLHLIYVPFIAIYMYTFWHNIMVGSWQSTCQRSSDSTRNCYSLVLCANVMGAEQSRYFIHL